MPNKKRGLPSLYTAAELTAWRLARGLEVQEMAALLGIPVSTLSKKLNGKTRLTLRYDRQIEGLDANVGLGWIPPGAPQWLVDRILARKGWDSSRLNSR